MLSIGPRVEIDLDIPGLHEKGHGNVFLVPCEDKVHELPWAGGHAARVGEVMCEPHWEDGKPQSVCPRTQARRQLEKLKELGLNILAATEVEFIVSKLEDVKKRLFDGCDAFSFKIFSEHETFFYDLDAKLVKSGLDIETMQIEYAPGQLEFVMNPTKGIESADQVFRMKAALKETFREYGYAPTFMTKPFADGVCSGFHFNHSLWREDTGENAMQHEKGKNKLSDTGRHWLAGLLKHAPALTALCCPTPNCYRRLHHPWAPCTANWGIDDRMATVRVKNSTPSRTYFESRLPSSASNPYLVLAGHIAAGIDGIVNKLECPPAREENLPDLPHSLEEALQDLEADTVMTEALGEEFMSWFPRMKRTFEIEKFKEHNINENIESEIEAERQSYFEFI